jgi:hypothetical protein
MIDALNYEVRNNGGGLSLCFRRDQHVVGDWSTDGCDAEDGAEGGVAVSAAIEAEGGHLQQPLISLSDFCETGLAAYVAR